MNRGDSITTAAVIIAPPGTVDLAPGQTYTTSNGATISWDTTIKTIFVSEMEYPLSDDWSVFGIPLQIKDVTGKIQQITTLNALIFLQDGSGLLIGSDGIGTIIKARYISNNAPLNMTSVQGYVATQIKMYVYDDTSRSRIPQGTLDQIIGWYIC